MLVVFPFALWSTAVVFDIIGMGGADNVGLDTWVPELAAFIGLALIIPSRWLGGSLVSVHGMGVEPTARSESSARRRRTA
jgi:uncharacterized membrane protein